MCRKGTLDQEGAEYVNHIMRRSNGRFYRWCVHTLLFWNRRSFTPNVVHIYGTADRVIRRANVHADHWIKDGSHLMIYNRAAEISLLISRILEKADSGQEAEVHNLKSIT